MISTTYHKATIVTLAMMISVASMATAVSSTSKLGAVDSTGNYIVAETTGSGRHTVRIIKRNSSSSIVWNKTYAANGATGTTFPTEVRVDASDNVYVAGYGNTGASDSSGLPYLFVQKYNPSGSLQWTRTTSKIAHSYATALAVDPSGNAYLLGHYSKYAEDGSLHTDQEFHNQLFKVDTSGGLSGGSVLSGLSTSLVLTDVQVNASNQLFVSGGTGVTFGLSSTQAVVAQLNSSLGETWRDVATISADASYAGVALDGSGNPITSYFAPDPNSSGNFINIVYKHQAGNGITLWSSTIGGSASNTSSGIIVDASGNVVFGGTTGGNVSTPFIGLTRIDGGTGALIDSYPFRYGSNVTTYALAQEAGGNYLVSGSDGNNGSNTNGFVAAFSGVTNIGVYSVVAEGVNIVESLMPTNTANVFYAGGLCFPNNTNERHLFQSRFSGPPSSYSFWTYYAT